MDSKNIITINKVKTGFNTAKKIIFTKKTSEKLNRKYIRDGDRKFSGNFDKISNKMKNEVNDSILLHYQRKNRKYNTGLLKTQDSLLHTIKIKKKNSTSMSKKNETKSSSNLEFALKLTRERSSKLLRGYDRDDSSKNLFLCCF